MQYVPPEAVVEEGRRIYANRNYMLRRLDAVQFAQMNQDGHTIGLCGYCLDAPDDIPAGSMKSGGGWPLQSNTVRGMTAAELDERNRLADELIAEILREERCKQQTNNP
mgnify:CR=1 FL=1